MTEYSPLDTNKQDLQKAKSAQANQTKRIEQDTDIKWLMGTKQGRRIAWRWLDQAGVFRSSFNTNAMQTAFNEGTRNCGLVLLAQIHELCPELYPVMVKEQLGD